MRCGVVFSVTSPLIPIRRINGSRRSLGGFFQSVEFVRQAGSIPPVLVVILDKHLRFVGTCEGFRLDTVLLAQYSEAELHRLPDHPGCGPLKFVRQPHDLSQLLVFERNGGDCVLLGGLRHNN